MKLEEVFKKDAIKALNRKAFDAISKMERGLRRSSSLEEAKFIDDGNGIKFDPDVRLTGSSQYHEFNDSESEVIVDWLKKNANKNRKIKNVLNTALVSDGYSADIAIRFSGRIFSLYARDGQFRIGAGGPYLSSPSIMGDIPEKFIKAIK